MHRFICPRRSAPLSLSRECVCGKQDQSESEGRGGVEDAAFLPNGMRERG